jgi:quercetin dioxygenase-like cupin family protein
MPKPFHYVTDLLEFTTPLPEESILSRNVFSDDHVSVTLFSFTPGQELSEHTAARPAILHFLEGEAELVLGEETKQARPGTWVYMPAHLPHSVRAQTPVHMLLTLLRGSG